MQGGAYKDAGVDIAAGEALVEAIKPAVSATARPGVMGALGGFGALFDPRAAGYADPILVSGTDGVGTKLKIAIATGVHNTVGIDLVAMCANDVLVQGAEPLYFLDYFGTGALEPTVAQAVVQGVAEGCRRAGCALTGGETAELPGLYAPGDYDLAGFCVGAVERADLIDGSQVAAGDVLLGLESDGLHANGFSLVRKIVETATNQGYDTPCPFNDTQTLGAALLTPTRIYVRPVLAALRAHPGAVHAMAHITGGGLPGNVARVVPEGLCAEIRAGAWPKPGAQAWLEQVGGIGADDALATWNGGIGLVLIVAPAAAQAVAATLAQAGERVHEIGRIAPGSARVRLA
jgi:phosphoribosylformylglycinamidine cyclo-ligase